MTLGTRVLGLWAMIVVPLGIAEWTPVPIGSQGLPEIRERQREWEIKTEGNAGGYAYLLPAPFRDSTSALTLSWEWRVSTFPRTTPKIPFEKASDDYALRIGALLSSDARMRVPRRIEDLLEQRHQSVSYVLFYCAVPTLPDGPVCAVSPYNDHIVNCLVAAGSAYKRVTRSPIRDAIAILKLPVSEQARLKVTGLWVFADSDNSHSSSAAGLRRLEASQDPGFQKVLRGRW